MIDMISDMKNELGNKDDEDSLELLGEYNELKDLYDMLYRERA